MAGVFAIHLHVDASVPDRRDVELMGAQDAHPFHTLQAVPDYADEVPHVAHRILPLEQHHLELVIESEVSRAIAKSPP